MLRTVGVGGMGTVYEGEHIEIHRKVAVKLLHSEFAQNADAVGRFRREAQIAGSLGHDNICDVLDVGVTEEGHHFLVMPLLKGASLAHILTETGPMPATRALDIIAQVLGALDAAHKAGVVHRDLKPENVFITRVGDREDFVKVLDFGISKVVSTGGVLPSSMTRTGTVMGTPYYMSPEQARGQKDQDHRVDVYATGVMLYEMLTGKRPYDGDTFNELIIKIVTESYVKPTTIKDGIHPRVEAIVDRAMVRDRDQRYPDAASMRADVLAVRAGLSGSIPGTRAMLPLGQTGGGASVVSPSPTQRHDPAPRSRKGVLVAAAAAVLLLVGGAVVFAFSGRGSPAPPVTASPVAMPFPATAVLPAQTAAPATAAPATAEPATVVGVEPPPPDTAAPATERTARRRRTATGTTAAPAPATAAPARQVAVTAAPDRRINSRIIEGAGGISALRHND